MQPGLVLTFPNNYQHPQLSFTLLDQTRFGRQTLVLFLLVDPEVEGVVGMAEVAPQQQPEDWMHCMVEKVVDFKVLGEVVKQVMNDVEGIMNMPEVEEYVRELRKESLFVQS